MEDSRKPSAVEWLLEDLCVQLGYCAAGQDPARFEELVHNGPEAFADAVLLAEGLNPEFEKQVRGEVCAFVTVRFGRWAATGGAKQSSSATVWSAYRFVYELRPSRSHPDYGRVEGGMASCWVLGPSHADAGATARAFLTQLGYTVGTLDSSYLETAERNPPGSPGHASLEQVQADGIVVTIHEWGASDH